MSSLKLNRCTSNKSLSNSLIEGCVPILAIPKYSLSFTLTLTPYTPFLGNGKKLILEALPIIKEKLHPKKIYIEAQKYAEEFYKKLGFITKSKEFLEDGIPHIIMELDI